MRFKRTDARAIVPSRAHPTDAGLDIYALENVFLKPYEIKRVKTGIAIALNPGQTGLFWDKSGLAAKGLTILGGCIDSGYRGELIIIVINLGNEGIVVPYGNAITQLLLINPYFSTPIECEFDDLTDRGEKGFGSSDPVRDPSGSVRDQTDPGREPNKVQTDPRSGST